MPGDLTDSALVAASWSDPEQFAEIFERHFPAVFAFVVRAVGPSDGADLAAEVFTRAFAIRRRYDLSYENARPWLFGIATNLIAGHIRRRAREARRFTALQNGTDKLKSSKLRQQPAGSTPRQSQGASTMP